MTNYSLEETHELQDIQARSPSKQECAVRDSHMLLWPLYWLHSQFRSANIHSCLSDVQQAGSHRSWSKKAWTCQSCCCEIIWLPGNRSYVMCWCVHTSHIFQRTLNKERGQIYEVKAIDINHTTTGTHFHQSTGTTSHVEAASGRFSTYMHPDQHFDDFQS